MAGKTLNCLRSVSYKSLPYFLTQNSPTAYSSSIMEIDQDRKCRHYYKFVLYVSEFCSHVCKKKKHSFRIGPLQMLIINVFRVIYLVVISLIDSGNVMNVCLASAKHAPKVSLDNYINKMVKYSLMIELLDGFITEWLHPENTHKFFVWMLWAA